MENQDKNRENLSSDDFASEKQERDIFERTARYDPLEKKPEEKSEDISPTRKAMGDIKFKPKSPFMKKLENFFYHYKWHTIAAVFVIFVLVLCLFQTCNKTQYDAYIMYAGGENLRTVKKDEVDSTYKSLYKSIGSYLGDYNGDGERGLSFIDLYLPSDAEIKELEKGEGVPYARLEEDGELFRNNLLSGDFYVCLIAEHLYEEWTKDENNPFVPVKEYLPSDAKIAENEGDEGYRLASEWGVYLSSTPIKDKPGFKYLPDDTVICLRKFSSISSPGKKGKTNYEYCENLFRAMLAGKTYE